MNRWRRLVSQMAPADAERCVTKLVRAINEQRFALTMRANDITPGIGL